MLHASTHSALNKNLMIQVYLLFYLLGKRCSNACILKQHARVSHLLCYSKKRMDAKEDGQTGLSGNIIAETYRICTNI